LGSKVDSFVNALHHAGENETRVYPVLVCVHSDPDGGPIFSPLRSLSPVRLG